MTFWGGLVDTQGVFTSGTPAQVRDDVRRRIDDLGPNGGFVAATVHNIQANVPPENIMAMWETLQEYGVYGPGGVGQRPADYVPGAAQRQAGQGEHQPRPLPATMPTPEEAARAAAAAERGLIPELFLDMQDAIIDGQRTPAVAAAKTGVGAGLHAAGCDQQTAWCRR